LTPEVRTKLAGIASILEKGETHLFLTVISSVIILLESTNRSFQSPTLSVSDALITACHVGKQIVQLRTEAEFKKIFDKSVEYQQTHSLKEMDLPRKRKVSAADFSRGVSHSHTSADSYFRQQYFQLLDLALVQLERMSPSNSKGLQRIQFFEKILQNDLTEEDKAILSSYKELDVPALSLQLPLFRQMHPFKTVGEAVKHFQGLENGVKEVFREVKVVLCLILVCPVTTAEAERNFSALRRLKTWLRSTMSQKRLNSVALCSIHKERLQGLDIDRCLKEFVSVNNTRCTKFGL